VDEREVDEQQPQDYEDQVGAEADAIAERTGDERRRDDREHHLIRDEHQHRDLSVPVGRARCDAGQEGHVEVADDPAFASAEAEREAHGVPDDRRDAHRDEALDHDRQHVLAADETSVEESEARRHEHDEAGRNEHETGIAGVEAF
jgi:hypothetical protein